MQADIIQYLLVYYIDIILYLILYQSIIGLIYSISISDRDTSASTQYVKDLAIWSQWEDVSLDMSR